MRPGSDGGTSCAPRRSRATSRAAPSVEECEAQFPFVCTLVFVPIREDPVGLVLGAQEEAPREVEAQPATDIGRLLGSVGRLYQSRFRLDVRQSQSDREERRKARLREDYVRKADIADHAVGELAEVVADRPLERE